MSQATVVDPVDTHVGARLQDRRIDLRLSEEAVAGPAGLSTRELRAFEEGETRVSAAVLWKLARALEVEPGYFFEGIEDRYPQTLIDSVIADSDRSTRETFEVFKAYWAIEPRLRHDIRRLLTVLGRS